MGLSKMKGNPVSKTMIADIGLTPCHSHKRTIRSLGRRLMSRK